MNHIYIPLYVSELYGIVIEIIPVVYTASLTCTQTREAYLFNKLLLYYIYSEILYFVIAIFPMR